MPFAAVLPDVAPPRTKANVSSDRAGLNQRDFLQLLKKAFVKLDNYWKPGLGRFKKAPGLDLQFEITTGTDAGKSAAMWKEWFPGYQVEAHGKTLKVRDTISETTIDVKDDFTKDVTDGQPYGGYFYVADDIDGDNIGYLSATLAYDAQTANFTVGKILTGGDSEAKALILADADSGTTGTLTLKIIAGSFQDDEAITDSATGVAVVNGTLAVSWTEITGADVPKAKRISLSNSNRLIVGNTDEKGSQTHTSRVAQGTIPFSANDDWVTTGSDPDDSFTTEFDNAGTVNGFGKLGKQTIVILDNGKMGFRIGQIDVSGTGLVLDTPIDFDNVDFGGSRAIRTTSRGIFYVNEAGIFSMLSGGERHTPFTAVDAKLSEQFGENFTKNFDLTDADLEVDDLRDLLLVSVRDDASFNNVVLVYHLKKDLRGWAIWDKNVARFLKLNDEIWVADSTETSFHKLDFELGADNNKEIPTELTIEPVVGSPHEVSIATEIAIAGEIGSGTDIEITVDKYDREWNLFRRIKLNGSGDNSYHFTKSGVAAKIPGVGDAMREVGLGGRGIGESLTMPAYGQRAIAISDFLRIRIRAESFDLYPHEINLFTIFTESQGVVETQNLTS